MTKNIKSALAVLLSVLLIAAAVPAVFAEGFEGAGTEDDPYVIADAADMALLSENIAAGESYSGKYFVLGGNVDLGDSYVPAGTEETPFEGTFDGAGYTFTGDFAEADDAGLFAFVKNAVLRDLTVSDYQLVGDNAAAAIAVHAEDTEFTGCKASGCSIYGYEGATGGIVGEATGCTVTDCESSSEINSVADFAGGIAGISDGGITDCTNSGTVSGYKTAGGIVGSSSGTVSGCRNTGDVSVIGEIAGGIAGESAGKIASCLNKGSVEGLYSGCGMIGGIVGSVKNGSVSECSNSGSVSAKDKYGAGVAAYVYGGTVADCFNEGMVTSTADYAAGIFGYLGNTAAASVSDCYNVGAISGIDDGFAGIGGLAVLGTVSGCIASDDQLPVVLSNTKAKIENCKTVEKSALADEATFSGWDFTDTWEINGYHSYNYPVLRSVEYHELSFLKTVEPTCLKGGYDEYFCSVCMEAFSYDPTDPAGHDFVTVSGVAATCTEDGYADLKCSRCDATKSETYKATGHTDADGDLRCDVCGKLYRDNGGSSESEKSFFEKVADFFRRIIEWIRNLFK